VAELIVKRGTTYHARLDVPADVQPIIGKKVLGKSLKTSNLAEAKAAGAYVIARWREEILDARGRLNNDTWKLEAFEEMSKHRAHYVQRGDLGGGDDLFNMIAGQGEILNKVLERYFPNGIPDEIRRQAHDEASDSKFFGSPPKVSFFNHLMLERFKEYRLQEVEITTAERDYSDMKALGQFLDDRGYGFDVVSISMWIESLDVKRVVKKRKLQAGKAFIKWLQKNSYYSNALDNPFEKVELPKEKRKQEDDSRQPFTTKEVEALYSKIKGTDDLLANTVAIAAYTGMRAEEIAQIKVTDIFKEEGSYFIRVSRQATKTDAGVRVVPIHQALEPLVLRLKESTTTEYLLDYETHSRIGKRSVLLVTRFSKVKRSMGFPSTKTFHSFRHTLTTQLERASIPENVAADIVGHAKTTMTYGLYSGGTSLKLRKEAINQIEGFSFL